MKKDYKMESIKNYLLKELSNLVPNSRVEQIQKASPEKIQIKISKNPENKILLKIKTDKKNQNQITLNCFIEKNSRCDIVLEKKVENDDKVKINLLKNIEKSLKKHEFSNSELILKINSRKMVYLKRVVQLRVIIIVFILIVFLLLGV